MTTDARQLGIDDNNHVDFSILRLCEAVNNTFRTKILFGLSAFANGIYCQLPVQSSTSKSCGAIGASAAVVWKWCYSLSWGYSDDTSRFMCLLKSWMNRKFREPSTFEWIVQLWLLFPYLKFHVIYDSDESRWLQNAVLLSGASAWSQFHFLGVVLFHLETDKRLAIRSMEGKVKVLWTVQILLLQIKSSRIIWAFIGILWWL